MLLINMNLKVIEQLNTMKNYLISIKKLHRSNMYINIKQDNWRI